MKVSLKDDSLPEGTELHVRGLGTLKNGKSVEFDKEAIDRFEAETGKKLADAFNDDPRIELSSAGSKRGDS